MAALDSRLYQRTDLPDLLHLVTANAQARCPDVTYLLNSDVAWRLPGSNPKENIRLWYDARGIAAYAWFDPGAPCDFDIRTDLGFSHPVAKEIIDWCESRTRSLPPMNPWLLSLESMAAWEQALDLDLPSAPCDTRHVQLTALEGDEERTRFLTSCGYEPTGHFAYSLTRDLNLPIPDANIPEGTRLRHVEPADFEQRVAVHRKAWHKSSFTLEQYLRIRAIPEFVPELDIVAEDQDGVFGSYCIGWIDRALAIGSFEPVGTPPSHRRRGLGQQVNFEGLRRMKRMGMESARIGTAGFNDRAFALYCSCGFTLRDKNRTFVKVL